MADTEKENDKEPSLGESSGKQDWFRAGALIGAGINIDARFISPVSNAGATAGGVNVNGAPLNAIPGAACGSGVPTAALVGTGTLEGTNKYSAPILGGPGPYGLVPGYTKPWPGTYATYRIASAHPTHVIAGASLVGQVLGSQWSYESKRNAPSGARAFIQETLEPRRTRLLIECLKAVKTFGFRAFEKVFEVRDGMVRLVKLKPLLPELTDILVDDKGNFAGVRNTGVDLGPDKVFIYTYDQDGDYFYGRPRLENTRRVWSNWLNTEDQLGRLGSKTSSIIPIMRYPPGQGYDSLGQPRTNYQIAVAMAAGLASGRPIVVPNLAGLQLDDFRNLSEFADKSLWGIDTIDMGNPGPAIEALLKQLQYYDTLMVRGMLRPERSLLEQSRGGGSRADSETHSDIGISDSDMVYADIVAAINEQVVNQLLVLNYGDEARDTVRIKAAPLSDDKQLVDQELLSGLIKSPQGLAQLIAHTDMEAWMDRVGLPKNQAAGEWDGTMTESAPTSKPPQTEEESLHLARDKYANGEGHWVTIDGRHVFIRRASGRHRARDFGQKAGVLGIDLDSIQAYGSGQESNSGTATLAPPIVNPTDASPLTGPPAEIAEAAAIANAARAAAVAEASQAALAPSVAAYTVAWMQHFSDENVSLVDHLIHDRLQADYLAGRLSRDQIDDLYNNIVIVNANSPNSANQEPGHNADAKSVSKDWWAWYQAELHQHSLAKVVKPGPTTRPGDIRIGDPITTHPGPTTRPAPTVKPTSPDKVPVTMPVAPKPETQGPRAPNAAKQPAKKVSPKPPEMQGPPAPKATTQPTAAPLDPYRYAPKDSEDGKNKWVEGKRGDGVFRFTDKQIIEQIVGKGKELPDYLDVIYKRGFPVYSPFLEKIGGVSGEVDIRLSENPKESLRRADDDKAADAAYADKLNKAQVPGPNGGQWTQKDVENWRQQHDLAWHHHQNATTMQLVPWELNDKAKHLGGRALKNAQLRLQAGISLPSTKSSVPPTGNIDTD